MQSWCLPVLEPLLDFIVMVVMFQDLQDIVLPMDIFPKLGFVLFLDITKITFFLLSFFFFTKIFHRFFIVSWSSYNVWSISLGHVIFLQHSTLPTIFQNSVDNYSSWLAYFFQNCRFCFDAFVFPSLLVYSLRWFVIKPIIL